jgi:hypothetical protein
VPNIFQGVEIQQEKEIEESFEKGVIINAPCTLQDGNDHNAHILASGLK